MLRMFGEGKKQIVRRLRRLMDNGVYHMAEFMAVRIDQLAEKECWCVLVFRDIDEEYQQVVEKIRRSVSLQQLQEWRFRC